MYCGEVNVAQEDLNSFLPKSPPQNVWNKTVLQYNQKRKRLDRCWRSGRIELEMDGEHGNDAVGDWDDAEDMVFVYEESDMTGFGGLAAWKQYSIDAVGDSDR